MAPLKVTYFDIAGVAEPIRWTLEVGGVEWEDRRLSREEFAELKPTLPNGQVPILEGDGFVLAQSMAILRYVGKLGGLYPADDLDAAKCDAVMDCGTDLSGNVRPSMLEKDDEKKASMRKDLTEGFLPKWLGNMSNQLEAAGGSYFCCGKLTVADIAIVTKLMFLPSLDHIPATILDDYPALKALMETVLAHPKVAAFTAKHAK